MWYCFYLNQTQGQETYCLVRASDCLSVHLTAHHKLCTTHPTILSESFLKLCRCFCQGLKMCMTFGCNPHINLYHFFRSLRSFFGSSSTNAYRPWVSCERSSSCNQRPSARWNVWKANWADRRTHTLIMLIIAHTCGPCHIISFFQKKII